MKIGTVQNINNFTIQPAPNQESRIPTLNSRIPKPGKFHRFLPSVATLKILSSEPQKYQTEPQKHPTNPQLVSPTLNETFAKSESNDKIPNLVKEIDKTYELPQNNQDQNETFIKIETEEKVDETFIKDVDKVEQDNQTYTKNNTLVNDSEEISTLEDKNATVVLDSNKIEVTFIQHQSQEKEIPNKKESQHPSLEEKEATFIQEKDPYLDEKDIDKRVIVGNVQTGVLKYVGKVKFESGIWCGVELDSPVGRHDGSVKGIRYFTCPERCGIIAPISKVVLLPEEDTETQKEDKSGPYSFMELDISRISKTFLEEERRNVDKTYEITNKRLSKVLENHHIDKKTLQDKRRSKVISGTFIKKRDPLQGEENKHATSTPTSEKVKRRSAEISYVFSTVSPLDLTDETLEDVCQTTAKKFNYSPNGSPVQTPTFPKQNSFEMDESLGILTPDQMKDFPQLTAKFKTPSSDDLKSLTVPSRLSDKSSSINSRTPSSENLGTLLPEGFKQPVTTVTLRPTSIELEKTGDRDSASLKVSEISSPNMVDQSTMDYSLGLLDDDVLASNTMFSSHVDTTTNLELPLDPINLKGDFKSLSRSDQTPSPEDLPLDPIDPKMDLQVIPQIPIIPEPESETKLENPKSTSVKSNSFITSITSITSLDTGYQGDGEMSRPASRGADHSPGAHKPSNVAGANLHWQRAITRRQDPMTDSDFFTESDADPHDELAPKGDRRAQVIDGTLYGANPQSAAAAADIYINNQEEMDSSGIFTDFDTNPRTEDLSDGERNKEVLPQLIDDKSPSDISSKSISENSQQRPEVEPDVNTTLTNETHDDNLTLTEENLKSPTQSIISTESRKSQRTRTPLKEESPNKKIKLPKRNVQSKVKTMLEASVKPAESSLQENRKPRKTINKWDAVMSKISKGEDDKGKIKLNQVKSKISTGIGGVKRNDGGVEDSAAKTKVRRVRARVDLQSSKQNSRTTSSIHSSVSDLSVGVPPVKQISPSASQRSAKKREAIRCATPVTEVLTAQGAKQALKVSPRTSPRQQIIKDLKKSPVQQIQTNGSGKAASVGRRTPTRHTITGTKAPQPKDQSRVNGAAVAVKEKSPTQSATAPHDTGGPQSKPPAVATQNILPKILPHLGHSAKGFEALSVLVEYLVYNLEAFKTPQIKRELEEVKTRWQKGQLELEEIKMGYRKLEDTLQEQKTLTTNTIDEERKRCRAEITDLFEKHRRDIEELNVKHQQEIQQIELRLQTENQKLKSQLDLEISKRESDICQRLEAYTSEHNQKLKELKLKNERLKQEHQIALEILREENDSIRDQLEDKSGIIQDLEELKIVNDRLKIDFNEKERYYEEKLSNAQDEIALLKEENRKILETFKNDTKDNKIHQSQSLEKQDSVSQAALGRCTQLQDEVESLRSVLDLKLAELAELRRAHGELTQAAEELPGALHKCQTLQARVEDLELQLARKTDLETQLTKENKRLSEICTQETKQKKRLSLYNEELQWKLKQNSEVVNALLQGQTPSRNNQSKSMHDQDISLNDESQFKTPTGSFLNRSLHSSSFNEKHYFTHSSFEKTFKQDISRNSNQSNSPKSNSNRSQELFDLEVSPPSSPKVKGVVEKSDSVSWVLDLDESAEVLVSRMVRRAGSFRSSTPPKNTPIKSPAIKRARTKSNTLSLSASSSAIITPGVKTDRHRSKSVSLRDTKSPERNDTSSKSWQLKSLRKQKSIDRSDSKAENFSFDSDSIEKSMGYENQNQKIWHSEPNSNATVVGNVQKDGDFNRSKSQKCYASEMAKSWHSEPTTQNLTRKNGGSHSNGYGSGYGFEMTKSCSVEQSRTEPTQTLQPNGSQKLLTTSEVYKTETRSSEQQNLKENATRTSNVARKQKISPEPTNQNSQKSQNFDRNIKQKVSQFPGDYSNEIRPQNWGSEQQNSQENATRTSNTGRKQKISPEPTNQISQKSQEFVRHIKQKVSQFPGDYSNDIRIPNWGSEQQNSQENPTRNGLEFVSRGSQRVPEGYGNQTMTKSWHSEQNSFETNQKLGSKNGEFHCSKSQKISSTFPEGYVSGIMHKSWSSVENSGCRIESQETVGFSESAKINGKSWKGSAGFKGSSKSVSVKSNSPDSGDDIMCKSWHYCTCTTSTPTKLNSNLSKHDCLDLVNDVHICLPKLPSEIISKSKNSEISSSSENRSLISQNFVKNSAGEAMISESNSEDEFSSSIEDQQSPSLSDTENSEENSTSLNENDEDNILPNSKKSSKMQYDLFLMTESTNSEIMGEFSSSEELES